MYGGDNNYFDEIIVNGWFSVDSFFFISGLLVAYLTFEELKKGRFNLILFYVLRYVRLTIPYAMVVGYSATIYGPFVPGPLGVFQENKVCMEDWWKNLLYIGIYEGTYSSCMVHSWYLAADWAMFIFSPIVMLPMYYLWRWGKRKRGYKKWSWLIMWTALFIGFTMVPIGITVRNGMPPYGIP